MPETACCKPMLPFSDDRALTSRFSPTMGEPPSPWPEAKWKGNIRHIQEGVFDSASQEQMKAHWAIINPIMRELPDVIGEFSWSERQFPAMCRTLKDAIEAADPELCSFVPMERLYDLRHNRIIEQLQYFYTAVRQHKDSIDPDAGETGTFAFADGSTIETLLPSSRIKPSALDGAMLWRDKKIREVLCNEQFKTLAETAGCVGMYFYEVKVSGAGKD